MNLHNLKNYWREAKVEARKGKRSRIFTFLDMVYLRFFYGFSPMDYDDFGFAFIRDMKKRLTFFNTLDWANLIYLVNNPKDPCFIASDKVDAYKKLKAFYKRDMLVLSEASLEELSTFLVNNESFFAKQARNYGGKGIEKLKSVNFSSTEDLLSYAKSHRYDLLEGAINQHPDISAINPYAINSLRVTTLRGKDGKILMLDPIMRFGASTSPLDNATSGGMWVRIDEDGKIASVAFSDADVHRSRGVQIFEKHPVTGVIFGGQKIPFFEDVPNLVEKLYDTIEEYDYFGWDIAITTDGLDIIEVNPYAGIDMPQTYCQKNTHLGDYDKITEALGVDVRSLPEREKKITKFKVDL